MALPRRRQQLGKFIPFHELTHQQVADVLGCSLSRVRNIINGNAFPSPTEIQQLERLFGLPVEVLLDAEMLEFRNGPWPPPRGTALLLQRTKPRPQAGE
ncbi:helix-turn-helix transcriptional regulator [Microbacterium sp. NPDC079995]|uniref:helix-turn-helix domain-containing protein n=1 Tax=unclassified Microbacterium TaxID=2609290 RepID=UPI00344FF990